MYHRCCDRQPDDHRGPAVRLSSRRRQIRGRHVLLVRFVIAFLAALLVCENSNRADEPSSKAASFLKLLKSGRVPEDRLAPLIKLVCRTGNENDLAYVLDRCVADDRYHGDTLQAALAALADASLTRDKVPVGDLTSLRVLLASNSESSTVQMAAINLAGIWHVASLSPHLQRIAMSPHGPRNLRRAAIDALATIDDESSRQAIVELTCDAHPEHVRLLGVAGLTSIDIDLAVIRAAEILAAGSAASDPTEMLVAVLAQQGSAARLAAALEEQELSEDVAKLTLRHLYSIGQSDEALVSLLSAAAGISAAAKHWTLEEIQQLESEVLSQGDARRGETVFRRRDLSCFKCHAVGRVGGQIGPDLIGLGGSSPLRYLIESVLEPENAVKEEFLVSQVLTDEGKIFKGIVKQRDETHLMMKDATGMARLIPVDSIEVERKGGSLMPQGLVGLMTRTELIDLVRFLSELGKPGGTYQQPPKDHIRRWRILNQVPAELTTGTPDTAAWRKHLLQTDPFAWSPAYTTFNGSLPLRAGPGAAEAEMIFVRGEFDVTVESNVGTGDVSTGEVGRGEIGIIVEADNDSLVWIDEISIQPQQPQQVQLATGRHRLTVRVNLSGNSDGQLTARLYPVEGSAAVAAAVLGP